MPEWAAHYINYKELKKLIKTIGIEARSGNEIDRAREFALRCQACGVEELWKALTHGPVRSCSILFCPRPEYRDC